jgi:ABC-2 type transport system permease protein
MEDKITFKRFLKLYLVYAKMDFAWLMRDTLFAVLAIFSDLISNISAISGIFLLALRFGGIGGMNKYEVLLMLAYTTMITGIFQLFFSGNNTGHISRRIGRGQLDHMLIQPIPLKMQLLTEGFIPFSGSGNLISGIVIICIAINKLNITLTWWWILSLAINLIISIVIIIALSYLVSSVTFYAPIQAEEISSYVIDLTGQLSNFPLSGMPIYLQLPLITVIPSGLMAWFPTLILLGKSPSDFGIAYPMIFALILSVVTAYFFKKGLNYYVKKGSNRYSAVGHRR